MQEEKVGELKLLTDPRSHADKNGIVQERPWRKLALDGRYIADIYEYLGCEKEAKYLRDCGSRLIFDIDKNGKKKLADAFFCRKTLCPMCQWRKSLKIFRDMRRIITYIEPKEYKYLLLTLTVKNVKSEQLGQAIDWFAKGWTKYHHDWRKLRSKMVGFYRSIEVTYNEVQRNYHPHMHVLLVMKSDYYDDVIYQKDFAAKWREYVTHTYTPITHIKAVRKGQVERETGKAYSDIGAICEVAKYAVKPMEYKKLDKEEMAEVIKTLHNAFFRRKLVRKGGVIAKVANELKITDAETGNLIHLDEDKKKEDVAVCQETYIWHSGLGNYYCQIPEIFKGRKEK